MHLLPLAAWLLLVADPHMETGVASWYGFPFHGRAAADGEIYHMERLTAAHRTLPFNTVVRVINLTNRKAVDVRIIDRGPFIDGRIIDLSHAAARAIGLVEPGIAQVRLEILQSPSADGGYAIQVGAFADRRNAERLRHIMQQRYGSARIVQREGEDPPVWRVWVGAETTESNARTLLARIRRETAPAFLITEAN
jgi:rare lipoprotein A